MSVQIMKRKLEETRDGLQEVEVDQVLAAAQLGHKVTAIVTYEVIEHRDNVDGQSTLVKAVHIEPLAGEHVAAAQQLQQSAYQVRTGNETLGIFGEGEGPQTAADHASDVEDGRALLGEDVPSMDEDLADPIGAEA